VRYALRSLRNSRGYTLACILVLALGVGANTAIFSLVYDAILKPLPYADADRLALIYADFPSLPAPMSDHIPSSRLMYRELQHTASFDGIAAFHELRFRESGVDQPHVLTTELVSANLLPLLWVKPLLGRLFRDEDDAPGSDRVVILSDAYFQRRFARDPAAIGKTLALGGVVYTVIGVLPRESRLPATLNGSKQGTPDVYIPLSRGWTRPDSDRLQILSVAARLRPGVSIERARDELRPMARRLHDSDAGRFPMSGIHVFSFRSESQSGDLNRALYVLVGAVGLVLLTGCANLANLTLARTSRRTRDIAVRRALGASRADIVRQLLTESMLLSAAGAACGLLAAYWMVKGLLRLAPSDAIRPGIGELSMPVFLFAAAVGGLTVLLFGVTPALWASGTDMNASLRSGDRAGSAAARRSRWILTAAEVAMALVLLTGAGLLLRSFAKVVRTELGFRTESLIAVDLELRPEDYPDRLARARVLDRVMDTARAVPGVTAAAMADALPLHRVSMTSFEIAGRPPLPPGEFITADYANVTPGYLDLLGASIVVGRGLTPDDVVRTRAAGPGVALVNRAFVDKFLPSGDPLHERLIVNSQPLDIVGVVANFRALGAEEDVRPQFFRPGVDGEVSILLMKSRVATDSLAAGVRNALGSIDERLATAEIRTMNEYLNSWLEVRWFGVVLISVFAGLALLLAMIGVHSVLANLVASRTREIGIRMALGATPAGIGTLIARQSLSPVLFGLVAGLAGGAALGRVIRSMLFQVAPDDPVTFAVSAAAIAAATPIAIWYPVRRATHVECTVALREE
jgi:putative ABC transport system permease protein